MLWRVANSQLHLLGSAHFLPREAEFLPHEAQILHEADVVAFEANIAEARMLRQGFYGGARSLRDDVDASLYEQTRARWTELGLAMDDLDGTRPWNAALRMVTGAILPSHGYEHRYGVDSVALKQAKAAKKTLFFLEPSDVGLSAFASGPLHEQVMMLAQAVRHQEEALEDVQLSADAWSYRDLNRIAPLYAKCMHQAPRTYTALLDNRNKLWTPKLLRLARGGKKTLAIVGMLHLHGPKSLLSLLEGAGHRCEADLGNQ
ncbi:MAG TPA: TraB/GumN family protein [Vicinamibacterales bacterium]|nr:TraB/GumN family protein [Vicinamibacterales bacterium]